MQYIKLPNQNPIIKFCPLFRHIIPILPIYPIIPVITIMPVFPIAAPVLDK